MKPFPAKGKKNRRRNENTRPRIPNLHEGQMEIYQVFLKINQYKINIGTGHAFPVLSAFVSSDHSFQKNTIYATLALTLIFTIPDR
jgi:hypothetical protein